MVNGNEYTLIEFIEAVATRDVIKMLLAPKEPRMVYHSSSADTDKREDYDWDDEIHCSNMEEDAREYMGGRLPSDN